MKKFTVFLMSMLLVFGLAACSSTPAGKEGSEANSGSQVSAQTSDTANRPDSSSGDSETKPADFSEPSTVAGGKTLVVYYSATGSTEKVAGTIAQATKADIFELVPVNAYSSGDLRWTDQNSRVVREHDNPDERKVELVKNTVDNWEEYDTVFIGYPIWWQIAAWPVDGFVKANDFTGKTVIPFCTSSSSGLGESGTLLRDMAGTGNWLEGQRFSSGASEQSVSEWVESLALNQ